MAVVFANTNFESRARIHICDSYKIVPTQIISSTHRSRSRNGGVSNFPLKLLQSAPGAVLHNKPYVRLVPLALQQRLHSHAILLQRQLPAQKVQMQVPALQLLPQGSHTTLQLIDHGSLRDGEKKKDREFVKRNYPRFP